jgi:xylulokinase
VFLGLDVGTSGVKAILVDADGEIAAAGTTPLALETPAPGWAEQDPEAWWAASCAAIREVLARRSAARVEAIGISGQMHSSVFLDQRGAVIRPALLWSDGRTTAECREIVSRAGGEAQLRDWVCNPALEGFTLPKVLWLRNHEPEGFARLAKVLLAKDFVRLRLTGHMATEPSDAAGTLMFDPAHLRWSREILDAVGLPVTLLPDVGGSAGRCSHPRQTRASTLSFAPTRSVMLHPACGTSWESCCRPEVRSRGIAISARASCRRKRTTASWSMKRRRSRRAPTARPSCRISRESAHRIAMLRYARRLWDLAWRTRVPT